MRFDVHFHMEQDKEVLAMLRAILNKLDLVIAIEEIEMASLDEITAQVSANSTVIDSAVVLINGIADRITAAGVDPVKLKALSDELKSKDDTLAEAVAKNTPAAT